MNRRARALALALVLATAAAACGDDDGDTGGAPDTTAPAQATSSSTTEAPGTTAPPTTEPGGPTTSAPAGEPTVVGSGLVEAWAPGGEALIVSDHDPDFDEPGCEGFPEPVLFRQPLDGSEREHAVPDAPGTGGTVILGPDGSAVIIDGCEGFTQAILRATVADDGTITIEGEVPAPPEGWPFGLTTGDLVAPDRLLGSVEPQGPEPGQVVEVDLTTGEISPVFDLPEVSFNVHEAADGRIVVGVGGSVDVFERDGTPVTSYDATFYVVSEDRTRIATFDGAVSVATIGEPAEQVATLDSGPNAAAMATWAGEAIAWIEWLDAGQMFVRSVAPGQEVVTLAGPGEYGRIVASPSGDRLAWSQFDSERPEELGEVVVAPVP